VALLCGARRWGRSISFRLCFYLSDEGYRARSALGNAGCRVARVGWLFV